MTKDPLILVVDDERAIRDFLISHLKTRGFACEETATAEGALTLSASLNPELILLDLGLPDRDGKEVVALIRQRSDVPIVVISARDQEQEKVRALDAGADDYLTKPFGLDELFARIRVALRRRTAGSPPPEPVTFGDLIWDPEHRLVSLADEEVHLTPLEYRLFSFMAANPGRLLTHGTLLKEVWGLSNLGQVHYVRIAMAALRKKLERDSGGPLLIRTEVGTGYRFFH